MSDRKAEKLKINDSKEGEDFAFSPEEMNPSEVASALESDLVYGLDGKKYKRLRRRFKKNVILPDFRLSFRESLKNQAKSLLGLFLAVSSLLMFIWNPKEYVYLVMTIVTLLIMFINAFSEYRASIALRVPHKYSALKARVVRNGEETETDSLNLVPGDVIILEQGCMVPADCRLIDGDMLSVLETPVSGRDETVLKDSSYIAGSPEAVSANMVYAESIVVSGHGTAMVCYTGESTLIRRIRSNDGDRTPSVLRYVRKLSRILSVASVIAIMLMLAVSVFSGADITKIFVCTIAVGASSLCDSMVSLCSSSLGFGAKKMAEDGAVVRNYGCIRKLASVDTVMCGRNMAFPPKRITLTGLYFSGRKYDIQKKPDSRALEILSLLLVCSDARRTTASERKQKRTTPEYLGTPLENAASEYLRVWNVSLGSLREKYIRMDAEYTPAGDVSRVLALHNGRNTVIVRGSPENILSRCVGYTLDGVDYKLSDYTRKKILFAVSDYARTNSFLIAVACGETGAETLRDIESEERLIFKGFISFSSSLDPGVAASVYRCKAAGIETVLNSDDAYYSAMNSAKSAGIISSEDEIITAEQIRSCDRGLFIANCDSYRLFLNADNEEWLDVIKIKRHNRRTVAVTGERLDELPMMKEADVSMVPEKSCDTLKRTSDILLLGSGINLITDSILNAKMICRRISSVVSYLVSGALMMTVAALLSVCYNQSPAFRTQDVMFGGLIFNLIFAFALAFAPRSLKALKDRFRQSEKPSVSDFIFPLVFSVGGGILLFMCMILTKSYTCMLLALTALLFFCACAGNEKGGIFKTKRFGNPLLFICLPAVLLILSFLMFTKPGHTVFGYGVPKLSNLMYALVLPLLYGVFAQIMRYFVLPEKDKKDIKKKKHKKHKKNGKNKQGEKAPAVGKTAVKTSGKPEKPEKPKKTENIETAEKPENIEKQENENSGEEDKNKEEVRGSENKEIKENKENIEKQENKGETDDN